MCVFNTSVNSGSSGLIGPMPRAWSLVCVSSGKVAQLPLRSSEASCWTLVFFNGRILVRPGGDSNQWWWMADLFAGLP